MDDFYKQFKDNLENSPEPEYEPRLWKQLNKDLNALSHKSPSIPFWKWLAVASLLFFMVTTIVFYYQLNKAQKMIASAHDLIASMQTERDTVVVTKLIYQTDTSFQKITPIQKELEYVINPFSKNEFVLNGIEKSAQIKKQFIESSGAPEDSLLSAFDKLPISKDKIQNKLEQKENTLSIGLEERLLNKKLDLLDIIPASAITSKMPELFSSATIETEQKKKQNFKAFLNNTRPKGFLVGINGGWASPFNNNLEGKQGYTLGLHTAISFSPNLQMWLDASLINTEFSVEKMDAALGVPSIQPPSDDLTFVKAEVNQSSLEYSIGMQYFFNANGNWKPFVGIGFAALPLVSYKIGYEFEDLSTQEDWDVENEWNIDELGRQFLVLRTGLAYKISDHWHLLVQGDYRNNLKSNKLMPPPTATLQTGLRYRF